jgi:hypothetical protein
LLGIEDGRFVILIKDCNFAAHGLARAAIKCIIDYILIEEILNCICEVVTL